MQRIKKLLPSTKQLRLSSQSTPTICLSSAFIRAHSTNKPGNQEPEGPRKHSISKDELILEQFKLRRQKGSLGENQRQVEPAANSSIDEPERDRDEGAVEVEVVSGYEKLGLIDELVEAVEEMGLNVPSEAECAAIPAVLDQKCIMLSSEPGPPRTLAYLLPLLQLLKESGVSKHGQPRAIVLCAEEEQSYEFFHMAKHIIDRFRSKSTTPGDSSEAATDMLVGMPDQILENIEEGDVVYQNINFLVLDGADAMLNVGFGPQVLKLLDRLQNHAGMQTIIVTSPVAKMLGKQASATMRHLEQSHKGSVAVMLLEIDQSDVPDLVSSVDGMVKKMAEAIDELYSS